MGYFIIWLHLVPGAISYNNQDRSILMPFIAPTLCALLFQVIKSLSNLKRRIAAAVLQDKASRKPCVRVQQLSQCPFHLSITSLDRHQDSHSIDTVMTWLDETQTQTQEVTDNRLNERLELRHLQTEQTLIQGCDFPQNTWLAAKPTVTRTENVS